MVAIHILSLFVAAITRFQQVNGREEHEDRHTVNRETGNAERYALSEVVVQPKVDILSLGHFQKRQDQPAEPPRLKNNIPANRTIKAGENHVWLFPGSELTSTPSSVPAGLPSFDGYDFKRFSREASRSELRRRDAPKVYFNVDVCSQPSPSGAPPSSAPPPLELFVSNSDNNKNPGPDNQGGQQSNREPTDGGHANYTTGEIGDTYLSVHAPPLSNFSGEWTYQISVSTEEYYTNYVDHSFLRYVDSDIDSALFVTDQLTGISTSNNSLSKQWQGTGGPFGLFIYNASDPMLAGVNRSYCGLMKYALAFSNIPGKTSDGSETGIKLSNSSSPYQQFYLSHLRGSTEYKAALSLTSRYSRAIGSNTPGGGGTVWKSVDFRTRSADNCKLIYNLTFCDDVAYSVPTNRSISTSQELGNFYDNFVKGNLWPNFKNSLDQIPCNTSNDARYSLARNCDHCQNAYKNWVCTVATPRCADFTSDAPGLKIRNTKPATGPNKWPNGTDVDSSLIDNSDSWNAMARNDGNDNFMNQTGPYKEVLPCLELCHQLVQSCPSSLGFACPLGKQQEWGYSSAPPGQNISADGYPACNFPGHLWGVNSGQRGYALSRLLLTVQGLLISIWLMA